MDGTAAAAGRIRAAIDGKPYGVSPEGKPAYRFAEVCPADVLVLAGQVKARTWVTDGLAKGASGALLGVPEDRAGEVTVFQYAHQLQELLDAAGV